MSLKDLWTTQANVEMVAISGTVRVEIHSRTPVLAILFEVAGLGWLVWASFRGWHEMALVNQIIVGSVLLSGAIGVAYLITRSELIEFDQQSLTIRRNIPGWEYTSRYPVDGCSELVWCVQDEESKFGLECKSGWRKLRFARNASEEQARGILALLQRELPEVAQKMGEDAGQRPRTHHEAGSELRLRVCCQV
jgi:hypothetical protein